jgi:hypothetical protein
MKSLTVRARSRTDDDVFIRGVAEVVRRGQTHTDSREKERETEIE